MLTTGGGWQDQVGGVYGGFKAGSSAANLPLEVSVQKLDVDYPTVVDFDSRILLIYTGTCLSADKSSTAFPRFLQISPCILFTHAIQGSIIGSVAVSEWFILFVLVHWTKAHVIFAVSRATSG